jgi:hypothetical protein
MSLPLLEIATAAITCVSASTASWALKAGLKPPSASS